MPTETPTTPDTKVVSTTDPNLPGAIRSLGRAGLIGLALLCLTIAVTGYFIYNRPVVVGQIPTPPALADGTAPAPAVKVEEEKDPWWMTCGPKTPIFEDEHGRFRYFDVPNPKSKLGVERIKVYGLDRERACVRYVYDADKKKTQDFNVVKEAVLTEDNRCLLNDKLDADLVVKVMCTDDDGKFSTAKKYENSLSTEPTPVSGLAGVRAACCKNGPLNACQSEDDDKFASR